MAIRRNYPERKRLEELSKTNERGKELGVQNPVYKTLIEYGLEEEDTVPDPVYYNNLAPKFIREPGLRNKILSAIEEGLPITTVCNLCGIDYKTFMDWLGRGLVGENTDFRDFLLDVRKAEANAEVDALRKIKEQADQDWRARAWYLERRWPDKWGRRANIKLDDQKDKDVETLTAIRDDVAKKVIDNHSARETARRALSGGPGIYPSRGSSEDSDR